MNYINTAKKCLVNRVNMVIDRKLDFDYAVTDTYDFTLLDQTGKIITPGATDEFYLAGKASLSDTTPIFICTDFEFEGDVISATVNTYTAQYLAAVKNRNTRIFLEVGRKQSGDETHKVIYQDEATAQPRVYVPGMAFPEDLTKYYDMAQIDEMFSGYYDKSEMDVFFAGYYGKSEIDTMLSGYYDKEEISSFFSSYYDKNEIDAYLAQLYTKTQVDTLLSGKLDKSATGSGFKFFADDNTLRFPHNTGKENISAVSGTSVTFTHNATIYSITPASGNAFTANVAAIDANEVYTCELWVNLTGVFSWSLWAIEKWLDGNIPVFDTAGVYWIALRYVQSTGKWYATLMMRP